MIVSQRGIVLNSRVFYIVEIYLISLLTEEIDAKKVTVSKHMKPHRKQENTHSIVRLNGDN
jgi:hypothetical protein